MTVTDRMAVFTFYKLIRPIDNRINTCVQFVLPVPVLNTEALDTHSVRWNMYLVFFAITLSSAGQFS